MADALTWAAFIGFWVFIVWLIYENTRGPGGGRPA